MSIFRRRGDDASPPDQAAATRESIRGFWAWWQTAGAARTAEAIAGPQPARMVDEISGHVHAVHPGLAWELGPGQGASEHVLVVTAEGDPALRGLARRWRIAAPEPDATWEYSDVRLPAPDVEHVVLRLVEVDLDAGSATADVRVEGTALDVVVHHPAYPQLPQEARDTATFLLLDAVLGESVVETWIG